MFRGRRRNRIYRRIGLNHIGSRSVNGKTSSLVIRDPLRSKIFATISTLVCDLSKSIGRRHHWDSILAWGLRMPFVRSVPILMRISDAWQLPEEPVTRQLQCWVFRSALARAVTTYYRMVSVCRCFGIVHTSFCFHPCHLRNNGLNPGALQSHRPHAFGKFCFSRLQSISMVYITLWYSPYEDEPPHARYRVLFFAVSIFKFRHEPSNQDYI